MTRRPAIADLVHARKAGQASLPDRPVGDRWSGGRVVAELERVTKDAGGLRDERQLRDRTLVAFLLSTGCRISEAFQLNRADWNRDWIIMRGMGDLTA